MPTPQLPPITIHHHALIPCVGRSGYHARARYHLPHAPVYQTYLRVALPTGGRVCVIPALPPPPIVWLVPDVFFTRRIRFNDGRLREHKFTGPARRTCVTPVDAGGRRALAPSTADTTNTATIPNATARGAQARRLLFDGKHYGVVSPPPLPR